SLGASLNAALNGSLNLGANLGGLIQTGEALAASFAANLGNLAGAFQAGINGAIQTGANLAANFLASLPGLPAIAIPNLGALGVELSAALNGLGASISGSLNAALNGSLNLGANLGGLIQTGEALAACVPGRHQRGDPDWCQPGGQFLGVVAGSAGDRDS
ncbi:hypothetical protein H7K38_14685, partial [Mycobacterium alsense]|nr:hypothetical protein [Mycobacterium alsense]